MCVAQTALDLKSNGYEFVVMADADGSRRENDHATALARMRDAGIIVASAEMFVLSGWKEPERWNSKQFPDFSSHFEYLA